MSIDMEAVLHLPESGVSSPYIQATCVSSHVLHEAPHVPTSCAMCI